MTDIGPFNAVMNRALGELSTPLLLKKSELVLLSVHLTLLEGPVEIREHEHANFELSLMEKGGMDTWCDEFRVTNTPLSNNILFVPPGNLHHRLFSPAPENINFTMVFTIREPAGGLLNRRLARLAVRNGYEFAMTPQLREIWKQIRQQGLSNPIFAPQLTGHLIHSFLLLFMQQIMPDSDLEVHSAEEQLKQDFGDDRVKTIKSLLVKMLAHPSPVKELAHQLDMSPRHLNRLFTQETGTGLKEYQMKLRFQHACNLLSGTKLPVSEIAASLGFSRKGEFAAFFRKQTGHAPGEYRRIHKIDAPPFL